MASLHDTGANILYRTKYYKRQEQKIIDTHMPKTTKKKSTKKSKSKRKSRCWQGYKPTPGVKAYEKGSCMPAGKKGKKNKPMKH
tara:strand:+ start:494 stop:745 length:252 start_codon:yes stop_codon:yes gene_type:complete